MRVFVTGASGFIGSAVTRELLASGHRVLGLARSEAAAGAVRQAGAQVWRGALEDLESLSRGADAADGVIHTAYLDDPDPQVAAHVDRRAIEALAGALQGSKRPLVVTTATGLLGPGGVATEQDRPRLGEGMGAHPRAANDLLALELASRGVNLSIVRPASCVHGEGDHAFIPTLIQIARTKGASAYVGDGSGRWPAVHQLDAAHLYRLTLEHGQAGSVFHAVAEQGVPTGDIAEVIGRHLNLPVVPIAPQDALEHFGWIGVFCAADIPASSAFTRQRLGWEPVHPGLVADLEAGHYFARA